jgi:hypothetical protein
LSLILTLAWRSAPSSMFPCAFCADHRGSLPAWGRHTFPESSDLWTTAGVPSYRCNIKTVALVYWATIHKGWSQFSHNCRVVHVNCICRVAMSRLLQLCTARLYIRGGRNFLTIAELFTFIAYVELQCQDCCNCVLHDYT